MEDHEGNRDSSAMLLEEEEFYTEMHAWIVEVEQMEQRLQDWKATCADLEDTGADPEAMRIVKEALELCESSLSVASNSLPEVVRRAK